MAAQTWQTLEVMLLAACVKAQPPYNTNIPGDFAALFPQATSYAEGRIFTDIPLLGHRTANATLKTVAGDRTVNLSAMINSAGGPIIVPETFALITPVGATPQSGNRVSFIRADTSVIDTIWPMTSLTVPPSITDFVPRYWAMRDDHTIIYAPTADAAYTVDIAGLFQPTPISAANPTTYISTIYPALLEAACMVFLSGALKQNYGAQMDDPRQGVSWEQQYGELMEAAKAEEIRRRGLMPPAPMPTPRGAAQ